MLGAVMIGILQGTRLGLTARAAIMNENLSRSLGINSGLVRFATFSIGSALAALAGALITPLLSVDPLMGVPWLLNAFMLVMVSGTSPISLGAACLVLGGAQVAISTYSSPVLGALSIVVLAAVLLRFVPRVSRVPDSATLAHPVRLPSQRGRIECRLLLICGVAALAARRRRAVAAGTCTRSAS